MCVFQWLIFLGQFPVQAALFPFCSNHLLWVLLETWLPLLIQVPPIFWLISSPEVCLEANQESFHHSPHSSLLGSKRSGFRRANLTVFSFFCGWCWIKPSCFKSAFGLRGVLSLHCEGWGPGAGTPTVWRQDSWSSNWWIFRKEMDLFPLIQSRPPGLLESERKCGAWQLGYWER